MLENLRGENVDICPEIPSNPFCYVCGEEGIKVTIPDGSMPGADITCAEAEAAGLARFITEANCALIEFAQYLINGACGCGLTPSPTTNTTEPPTGAPNSRPSDEDTTNGDSSATSTTVISVGIAVLITPLFL